MSTQPHPTPQWKEEVNRRLAAHKNRKGQAPEPETEPSASEAGDSRAAQAAARVAARYAQARSYSQMQAEEARVAVRAAEIATRVALQAQQVAETALAGLHAATKEPPSRRPAVVRPIAAPMPSPEAEPLATVAPAPSNAAPIPEQVPEVESVAPLPEIPEERPVFGIRWDPDMPVRPPERTSPPRRAQEEFELSVEDWWSPAEVRENLRSSPIEIGDDAPVQANLIQFPRELVATRKLRPRLGEVAAGTETDSDGQLSIFEVDPATVSTEAAVPNPEQGAVASTWSGMRLDTQPAGVFASQPETDRSVAPLPVAPLGLRLMSAVVDCSLILIGFVGVGFLVAHSFPHLPGGKIAELLGGIALALMGWAFYAFFFSFAVCTPGMRYAGIGLCTFGGSIPTRAQLRRRLTAMLLSVLPMGLGLVWSLFDEDHLSWHDRFSQTYLRRL